MPFLEVCCYGIDLGARIVPPMSAHYIKGSVPMKGPHSRSELTYSLLLDDVTEGDLNQRILPDQAPPHHEKSVVLLYMRGLSVGMTDHS